jgi:serine/threonine-protein kinase RsbW
MNHTSFTLQGDVATRGKQGTDAAAARPMGGMPGMEARDTCRDRQVYSGVISSDASVVCREVGVVLRRLEQYAELNEDERFDIRVILSELLQNAIRHGNAMDRAKTISLDVAVEEGNCLEISVEDEGTGFDVERVLAQKRVKAMNPGDLLEMDEFGRGLLIVETLCDTFRRNESGNRVTVRKGLSPLVVSGV